MKTPRRPWCSLHVSAWRPPLLYTFPIICSIFFLSGCGFQITFYDFDGDPIGQPKVKPRMVEEIVESNPVPEDTWNSYSEDVEEDVESNSVHEDIWNSYPNNVVIEHHYTTYVEHVCFGPIITIVKERPLRGCGSVPKNPCIEYIYW